MTGKMVDVLHTCLTPPKRSPVALVTQEKYGADMACLRRIFCFLACSLQCITQKSIEHRIGCNCGAFAPYFFAFLACSLQSITQKSIEHRIGCNCGAFAPYFFYFWLAHALNQTGRLADAL